MIHPQRMMPDRFLNALEDFPTSMADVLVKALASIMEQGKEQLNRHNCLQSPSSHQWSPKTTLFHRRRAQGNEMTWLTAKATLEKDKG